MVDLATAFLNGGARVLQVRAKEMPAGQLLDTTIAIVERARKAGAMVIVNDRADVARLAAADGVHVGQDDLPPAAVRPIVGGDAIVGLSTHTPDQIEAAVAEPISYLAIGPIFTTATKETGYEAVGFDRLRAAVDRARPRRLPVVAIGGITLERAADLVREGADSVAVIGDLLSGGDPEARVRAFVTRLSAI